MDPEVRARLSPPVVLVDREGVYVIIAVLGVSILGCACVLAYSIGNYDKLKKNAGEVRNYIAHRRVAVAADEPSGSKQTAAGGDAGPRGVRSVIVEITVPTASANEPSVGAGPSHGAGRNTSDFASMVRSVSKTFVVAAKKEQPGVAAVDQQHWNATTAGDGSGEGSSSPGVTSTTHENTTTAAMTSVL